MPTTALLLTGLNCGVVFFLGLQNIDNAVLVLPRNGLNIMRWSQCGVSLYVCMWVKKKSFSKKICFHPPLVSMCRFKLKTVLLT